MRINIRYCAAVGNAVSTESYTARTIAFYRHMLDLFSATTNHQYSATMEGRFSRILKSV